MSLIASIALTKQQPEKNIRRHYWLAVKRDLFGDVCVVREWGRIGGRSVQTKQDVFANVEEALKLFETIKRRKLKKGYRIESGSIDSTEEEADRRQEQIQAI